MPGQPRSVQGRRIRAACGLFVITRSQTNLHFLKSYMSNPGQQDTGTLINSISLVREFPDWGQDSSFQETKFTVIEIDCIEFFLHVLYGPVICDQSCCYQLIGDEVNTVYTLPPSFILKPPTTGK